MDKLIETGISPAVGVILLIGLSVATATLAGIVLLDIGERGLNDSVSAGVSVDETPDGVEVSWNTQGNAEEVEVKVNGETVSTLQNVNEEVVLGVDKGENVSVVGVSDDESQVIDETTTENDTNSTTGTDYTVKEDNSGNQNTVTGKVTLNPDIGNASVTVLKQDGTVVSSTTTESDGSFSTSGSVDDLIRVLVDGDVSYNGNTVYGSKQKKLTTTSNVTIDFDQSKIVTLGDGKSVVNNGSLASSTELRGIPDNSSKDYTLLKDIDASNTSSLNGGDGFESIDSFSGTVDGNGYTISGLTVKSGATNVGLFSSTTDATISNITFDNANIGSKTTNTNSGIVTGKATNTTFKNITVSNSLVEANNAGVLVGDLDGGTIELSRSIDNTVKGYTAGGIVGNARDSSVKKSYALEYSINPNGANGGGISGGGFNTDISNSYARSSNHRDRPVAIDANVTNVYGTTGGLTDGSITNSYYIRFDDEFAYDVTFDRGKYQMVEGTAEKYMSGFDFENVWEVNGDRYPTLRDNPEPTQQSTIDINEERYACKDISYTTNGSGALEVDTATKLHCIDVKPHDADIILTSDIDASKINDFQTIKRNSVFEGTIDGNGHTISNLTIKTDLPNQRHLGLFGAIQNGTVKDLTITNADVGSSDPRDVGVLAGNSEQSLISNVTVSNSTVKADFVVGGIVGNAEDATIELSASVNNTMEARQDNGGIAGSVYGGSITKSYVTGVSLNSDYGGQEGILTGFGRDATITKSYGQSDTHSDMPLIREGAISNSYNAAGPLRGADEGVSDSYYITSDRSSPGTELTKSEMQGSSASSNMSKLDFTNTWSTRTGDYPILQDNPE